MRRRHATSVPLVVVFALVVLPRWAEAKVASITLKGLVDGSDLIAHGYSEGPQLGQTLRTLLDEVVEDPRRNEREQLLRRARELA